MEKEHESNRAIEEDLSVEIRPIFSEHMEDRCPSFPPGFMLSEYGHPFSKRCEQTGWVKFPLDHFLSLISDWKGGVLAKEDFEIRGREYLNPVFPPIWVRVRAGCGETTDREAQEVHNRDELLTWLEKTFDVSPEVYEG